MRIHYSSTDCFEQCPMRYYFRYVERLETLEAYAANGAGVRDAAHGFQTFGLSGSVRGYPAGLSGGLCADYVVCVAA